MGKLLALHVAGHHHGALHGVEEHWGGVKGRRGVDGLDPLQHVLFVSGREDKMAAIDGLNLELVAERGSIVESKRIKREEGEYLSCYAMKNCSCGAQLVAERIVGTI